MLKRYQKSSIRLSDIQDDIQLKADIQRSTALRYADNIEGLKTFYRPPKSLSVASITHTSFLLSNLETQSLVLTLSTILDNTLTQAIGCVICQTIYFGAYAYTHTIRLAGSHI